MHKLSVKKQQQKKQQQQKKKKQLLITHRRGDERYDRGDELYRPTMHH